MSTAAQSILNLTRLQPFEDLRLGARFRVHAPCGWLEGVFVRTGLVSYGPSLDEPLYEWNVPDWSVLEIRGEAPQSTGQKGT